MSDQPPDAGKENDASEASSLKGRTGVARVANAFFYSLAGLRAAFRDEAAFRQELLLAAVLIPLALFMPVNGIGKALMIASVLLVLITELLNSAIEALADRISLEKHALIKKAKDIGSAAVLIALINVPVVWLLVLLG
jgi:diacylglycerol kinase (ATP)